MTQPGFFDLPDHLQRLSDAGDPLEEMARIIDGAFVQRLVTSDNTASGVGRLRKVRHGPALRPIWAQGAQYAGAAFVAAGAIESVGAVSNPIDVGFGAKRTHFARPTSTSGAYCRP
jgi:hypothetical protein